MKVLINTIGKKIHTLVKENTPCCHKRRQECSFTQKTSIFSVLLCFLPHCQAHIGRQVRLIPPNTYQETPIYALIFEKTYVKMCVQICARHVKKPV